MFRKSLSFLQEFSIPLVAGVLAALLIANLDYELYHEWFHLHNLFGDLELLGHPITFHFLINDLFMVLFFGIAAVEITQAVRPGGSLNPISRAINPLLGTLGGVVGPVGVYFAMTYMLHPEPFETVLTGWGVPTATDIALAWLVARIVFGDRHPAVSFLLLLAVADDAIGLGIIAVFYPDPQHPVEVYWLGLTLLGMASAFGLRLMNVRNFWLYILIGGTLSWLGLIMAHLHPALALVFIVPFIPADNSRHEQLFADEVSDHSPLVQFEHSFKLIVDIGLFGFGLANAGVQFAGINEVTWIVLGSLVIGKTVGITLLSGVSHALGFRLPQGMNMRTLILAGLVAGLGLTVALFVAGEAFTDPATGLANETVRGAGKMGAVFSAGVAVVAIILGRVLNIQKIKSE